jgi:predicted  nucleic acid-binding Zn-ribbon protein
MDGQSQSAWNDRIIRLEQELSQSRREMTDLQGQVEELKKELLRTSALAGGTLVLVMIIGLGILVRAF